MTPDQKEFLEYALKGDDNTILSVGGGPDDKLWQSMMDHGWMEEAPLPPDFQGTGGIHWTAWRITDAGRAALAGTHQ